MSNPYREYIRKAIAVLLSEVGFTNATTSAIETLVEMLQSCKLNCKMFLKLNHHSLSCLQC